MKHILTGIAGATIFLLIPALHASAEDGAAHNIAFCLKQDSRIDLTPLGKGEVGVIITNVGVSSSNIKGKVVVSAHNRHGAEKINSFWKSGMAQKLPLIGGSCYNLTVISKTSDSKEWACMTVDPNVSGSAMTFSAGVISGFIGGVSDVNNAAPRLHCPPQDA